MPCCGGSKRKKESDADVPLLDGQCRYQVGGRYRVARSLFVWSEETLHCSSRQATLQAKKDIVLVIHITGSEGAWKGLVIPQPAEKHASGWISLEDVDDKKPSAPLELARLDGSWEMKARYCVKNEATMRKGPAIASEWLHELKPGEEVLVLDLGVTTAEDKARLRALVSAGDTIGWVSPETTAGDHLLEPVNLLSQKVVDLHKVSMRSSTTGGPRKSYHAGGNTPWEAGATYRMLEKVPVRQAPELSSNETFKVSAGSLVAVAELHNVEVPGGGWCPVASITVKQGPEEGRTGWVRCSAKDGHDLMDTRDHGEYEKVIIKMRSSTQLVQGLPSATPAELQAVIVASELSAQREEENEKEEAAAAQAALEVVKEEGQEAYEETRGYPEDTDQDQKQPNTFREAFSEEKQRQDEQQREREAAESEQEAKMVKMTSDYHDKLSMLDAYEQDDRPIVDPRRELDDKPIWCNCSCGH